MEHSRNAASYSSDEASCSMFDDDCDNETNKWFETFFYNVDQAVFFDKKLGCNYEKIEKECKVWNSLFKLKKVDLTDAELMRTIFTSDKLGKKKSQFIEEDAYEASKHQLMRNVEKPALMNEDEMKYPKSIGPKRQSKQRTTGQFPGVNDKFDEITLLNQIKQDYIRKHVLSSSKSESNTTPYHSLVQFNNPNTPFPITTNGNLNRRKQMMEQNRMSDEAASNCLYFFPNKKEKKKKPSKEDAKGKVRTINSIIRIDQGKRTNLIINTEQLIKPKAPLVLPPIISRNFDLPQRFDKVVIRDQNEAILNCDKSSNQCSLTSMRKSHQFRASAFCPRQILSISDEYVKVKNLDP